jgi:hypothetical protein
LVALDLVVAVAFHVVVVIRADEHSATCRILRSNTEFQVGDLVTK